MLASESIEKVVEMEIIQAQGQKTFTVHRHKISCPWDRNFFPLGTNSFL